jgi:PEP-CTERM motif
MKKLMITAAALLTACAAYGQGQFFFNTHDTTAGNVLTFLDATAKPVTGSDFFVEVLAGASASSLAPLTPTLALNRTGAGAGFANPFSGTYTVAGMAGGTSVFVGYRAYEGTGYTTASVKSSLHMATSSVVLTEPPTPPNEVALGTHSVTLVPEPATLALGLLGLGTILAFRRRS